MRRETQHMRRVRACVHACAREYRPLFRVIQAQLPTDQNLHMQCKVRASDAKTTRVNTLAARSAIYLFSHVQFHLIK